MVVAGRRSVAQETRELVEMSLGADDAPVTLIEYASLTCPHCANFHKTVLPQLKSDYIDTGKVRLIYREVYFDRPSLWAAMIARCAGRGPVFRRARPVVPRPGDLVARQRRRRAWSTGSTRSAARPA